MKNIIKKILKLLGLKHIHILAVYYRKIIYALIDFLGSLLFLLAVKKKSNTDNTIKKILIIRIDRIGDLVVTTPAIHGIRETYPHSQIDLLVTEYTKDIVINNPDINNILLYKKDKIEKNYNLAIAFHPGIIPNYLTFASGAYIRAGYKGLGGSFFLTHKIKDDRVTRLRHEVESNIEIINAVGCNTSSKELKVSVTEEGEKYADNFFKKNGIDNNSFTVILHPGSRQPYLRWPAEKFALLANILSQKYNAKILLLGGTITEAKLLKKIMSLMEIKPIIVYQLPLTQLISIIKHSNLFIGHSTGPMHIAAGLKTPVIALFGPKHPKDSYQEWAPWSNNSKVITKNLNCVKCHPTDCRTYDCINLITVEEVILAVEDLIKKRILLKIL